MYGDSVDKIVQGNTSNIIFLKSTDDAMLDTLQKMSGVTHKAYIDSKSVSRDMEKLWMKNAGNVNYTMSTKEVPVISYNDMNSISKCNSILFRAGDSPVWNRNETILPMSWRLFSNTITQPGKKYSLQTVPTLSSAIDFDIKQNQPDFMKMLNKRMKQAILVSEATTVYQTAYGYSDTDMQRLDKDALSDELMDLITSYYNNNPAKDSDETADNEEVKRDGVIDSDDSSVIDLSKVETNTDVQQAIQDAEKKHQVLYEKLYADNNIGKRDLYNFTTKQADHKFDDDIVNIYTDIVGSFRSDKDNFIVKPDGLYSVNNVPYITKADDSEALKKLKDASHDAQSRVNSESDEDIETFATGTYTVHDAFYEFLVSFDYWDFANGEFEKRMASLFSS